MTQSFKVELVQELGILGAVVLNLLEEEYDHPIELTFYKIEEGEAVRFSISALNAILYYASAGKVIRAVKKLEQNSYIKKIKVKNDSPMDHTCSYLLLDKFFGRNVIPDLVF